ncbi:acid protease [Lactarius hengduanensis]|nr:acid protease [Lactarius hengduanensis]
MKLLVLLVSLAHTLPLLAIKFHDGFSAYERNTGERHPLDWLPEPDLQEKRAMGSIPLAPADQQLWYGSISVGTPAKNDLFLPGPRCEETCSGHAGNFFSSSFGDGSTATVEGYTDVVSIAGYVRQRTSRWASPVNYSTGFSISKFTPDGLLGLGYQSVSKYNATPFFINLISQGNRSELFLGGTKRRGSIRRLHLRSTVTRESPLDGIMLDGREVVSVTQAIIDTGSTLILGPAEVVEAIYGRIPGAIPALDPHGIKSGLSYRQFPCNFDMTIALKFGKRAFPIAPSIFNLGPVNGQPNRCYGGMASQSKIARFWILGDTFLQNVYTAFDFGRKSVGFASLVEPS